MFVRVSAGIIGFLVLDEMGENSHKARMQKPDRRNLADAVCGSVIGVSCDRVRRGTASLMKPLGDAHREIKTILPLQRCFPGISECRPI